MPLTNQQIEAIKTLIDGENGLNQKINKVLEAREDAYALMRIHADVADAECAVVLSKAQLKGKTAAQAIVTMLT